jgi:hypothetical protein
MDASQFNLLEMIKDKYYILELTDYKSENRSYTLKFKNNKIFDGDVDTAILEYIDPPKGGDVNTVNTDIATDAVKLLSVELTFGRFNENKKRNKNLETNTKYAITITYNTNKSTTPVTEDLSLKIIKQNNVLYEMIECFDEAPFREHFGKQFKSEMNEGIIDMDSTQATNYETFNQILTDCGIKFPYRILVQFIEPEKIHRIEGGKYSSKSRKSRRSRKSKKSGKKSRRHNSR